MDQMAKFIGVPLQTHAFNSKGHVCRKTHHQSTASGHTIGAIHVRKVGTWQNDLTIRKAPILNMSIGAGNLHGFINGN
jgi:hypothetical protein